MHTRYSPALIALLAVPWLFAGLALAPVPQLSTWGEGLLPELLGTHLVGRSEYAGFARALLLWTLVTLVFTSTIAFAVWYLHERAWSERLREFDVDRVLGYRGMVWIRVLVAGVSGVVVAVVAAALSPEIRTMPVVSTVSFILTAGVFGAVQFVTAVFALEHTHRLFFGR